MRREIGSEFWDVPITDQQNTVFPDSTQWYLSGRSALQAIITELGEARSVSLPSWCCGSIIKPFVDANMLYKFYPVVIEDGKLVQEVVKDTDVLFLMDYFGFTGQQPNLENYNGIVIRDVTHSIFSSMYSDADYYFGSLRKWCGVWTGGYAWKKNGYKMSTGTPSWNKYIVLRQNAMEQKRDYVEGRQEEKGYLRVFNEAEGLLENAGIAPATIRDVELVKFLDMESIRKKRRANAKVLCSAFPEWLVFPQLKPTDAPMFVPILVPDGKRDALRKNLIQNEIYCPIHWHVSEYHKLDERTKHIYQNELSLVCDQRYTEDDMNRIVETIKSFMEG